MRIFILCTGRTGSAAFIEACGHITNYSAGHETLSRKRGKERFAYSENHIEADNRLSWHLGELYEIFGDEPLYVHLTRDRDAVAKSFMRRFLKPESMIDAFSSGMRITAPEKLDSSQRLQTCYDYIDTVNYNIDHFLRDKPKKMKLNIENIQSDFQTFWNYIDAEGDLTQALQEFNRRHNSSDGKKSDLGYRTKLSLLRLKRRISC